MHPLLDRLVPTDVRAWLALGVFALMVYVLSLVAFVPDLDKSQLFTALASGVIGSGFGGVIGYYFASSKGSTDTRDLANKAMDFAKNAAIVVDPPATVTVKED